jgi:hypothetical protein
MLEIPVSAQCMHALLHWVHACLQVCTHVCREAMKASTQSLRALHLSVLSACIACLHCLSALCFQGNLQYFLPQLYKQQTGR